MTHIPPHRLLPGDMVDIFDHGPPHWHPDHKAWKDDHPRPVKHRMHASDARHAMDVDPARWKLHEGLVTVQEVGDEGTDV